MKIFVYLFIICFAEIYANDQQIFRECFQQYGEDYDAIRENPRKPDMKEIIEKITPYKLGCISVCYLKKQLVDDIPIKKHVLDSLNEPQSKFTDAEIAAFKSRADKCIAEAKQDDCKLIECLKPWECRIGAIIGIA